ncbi:hypothetical protein Z043_112240 [Scleropages formosus]|uniref:TIR domain-containing protein n=1 Tax=Scleropages formosus TaxID=113540 RepID=A0A0P7V769_SCLFO|nr:hypothetical protein Z043_112240 [Scleropages formosus]
MRALCKAPWVVVLLPRACVRGETQRVPSPRPVDRQYTLVSFRNLYISQEEVGKHHHQQLQALIATFLPRTSRKCEAVEFKVRVCKAEPFSPSVLYARIEEEALNPRVRCPGYMFEFCTDAGGNLTWYKPCKLTAAPLAGYKSARDPNPGHRFLRTTLCHVMVVKSIVCYCEGAAADTDFGHIPNESAETVLILNASKRDEGIYTCRCTWEHAGRIFNSSASRKLIVKDPSATYRPVIRAPLNHTSETAPPGAQRLGPRKQPAGHHATTLYLVLLEQRVVKTGEQSIPGSGSQHRHPPGQENSVAGCRFFIRGHDGFFFRIPGSQVKLACSVFFGFNVQDLCVVSWLVNGSQVQDLIEEANGSADCGHSGYVEENARNTERNQVVYKATLTICKVSEKHFHTEFKCVAMNSNKWDCVFVSLKNPEMMSTHVVINLTLLGFFILALVTSKVFMIDLVLFARDVLKTCHSQEDGKAYDAFVVYQTHNTEKAEAEKICHFVAKVLPRELEQKCGYRLFILGRDDLPGEGQYPLGR